MIPSDIAPVARIWRNLLLHQLDLTALEREMLPLILKNAPFGRVLEIGAGRGRMIKKLRESGLKGEFIALDVNDYVCESGARPVLGDARQLPFASDTFDLVYSLGVIEHFPESAIAVAEHVRVARQGGLVWITTPHHGLFTSVRYLAWWIRYRQLGTFEQVLGRNLTARELIGMVEAAGLVSLAKRIAGARVPGMAHLERYLERLPCMAQCGAYVGCIGRKPSETVAREGR